MLFSAFLLTVGGWLPAPQDAVEGPPSPDQIRQYLDRSAGRLYRAEEHGLKGLTFSVPFELPLPMLEPVMQQMGIPVSPTLGEHVLFGDIQVSWTAGQAPVISFETAADLDPVMTQLVTQLEPEYKGRGLTALDMALSRNADVRHLLRDFDAKLLEDDGALDQVIFTPRTSEYALPISRLVWFFDSDGVPVKTIMESEQPAPSGTVTVKRVQTNHWRPANDDTGKLVLDWAHTIQEGGSLGITTSEISFEYGEFEGIVLLTGFVETNDAEGVTYTSEVQLNEIVVTTAG